MAGNVELANAINRLIVALDGSAQEPEGSLLSGIVYDQVTITERYGSGPSVGQVKTQEFHFEGTLVATVAWTYDSNGDLLSKTVTKP